MKPFLRMSGWFLVGNEGLSSLNNSLKGYIYIHIYISIYRALIPSFPTNSQGGISGAGLRFGFLV